MQTFEPVAWLVTCVCVCEALGLAPAAVSNFMIAILLFFAAYMKGVPPCMPTVGHPAIVSLCACDCPVTLLQICKESQVEIHLMHKGYTFTCVPDI